MKKVAKKLGVQPRSSVSYTVSGKYQVVLPKAVRIQLGIKPGDVVTVSLLDDCQAVVRKRPKSVVARLDGLGSEVWESIGGAEQYLEGERKSWDD